MLAGAYTPSLRRAYDAGEDIRGAGILNLKWKVRETRFEGLVHEFCFLGIKDEWWYNFKV